MGTPPTDFSGREIVKVLRGHGFVIVDLLQKIASQSGADDFHKWCRWIGNCR